MTVSETPTEITRIAESLNDLSVDQIKEFIAGAFLQTAEGFQKMAAGVLALENRGVNVSELKIYGISYLRKIAYGQMLPELLAKFAFSKLLQCASNFPIPEQRRLAAMDVIAVYEISEDGATARMVPPNVMTPNDVRQVFASDHIRDEAEQVSWLRDQRRKIAPPATTIEREVYSRDGRSVALYGDFKVRDLERIVARLKASK